MPPDNRIRTANSVNDTTSPAPVRADAIRLDGPDIWRKRASRVLGWILVPGTSGPQYGLLLLASVVFVVLVLYLTVYRTYEENQKAGPRHEQPAIEFDENGKRLGEPHTRPIPEAWKR
jgi:hypothetical protein